VSSLTELTGHVVDINGDPVPEAIIAFVESSVPMPELALLADEDGRFWLQLPSGRFVMQAHGSGGKMGKISFEIEPPKTKEITIIIRDDA